MQGSFDCSFPFASEWKASAQDDTRLDWRSARRSAWVATDRRRTTGQRPLSKYEGRNSGCDSGPGLRLVQLVETCLVAARSRVRGGGRAWICAAPVASQPREKGRHLERHLVTRRRDRNRRRLDQFHVVIPGVQLDASAQGQ